MRLRWAVTLTVGLPRDESVLSTRACFMNDALFNGKSEDRADTFLGQWARGVFSLGDKREEAMTEIIRTWYKENQALVLFLAGQAILLGVYMVNLESRVSTLEVRGSPHLTVIDNRLTVLESEMDNAKDSIGRIKDKLTK